MKSINPSRLTASSIGDLPDNGLGSPRNMRHNNSFPAAQLATSSSQRIPSARKVQFGASAGDTYARSPSFSTLGGEGLPSVSRGDGIDGGVSLGLLQSLSSSVGEEATWEDLLQSVILPATASTQSAYVDVLNSKTGVRGRVTHVVSCWHCQLLGHHYAVIGRLVYAAYHFLARFTSCMQRWGLTTYPTCLLFCLRKHRFC